MVISLLSIILSVYCKCSETYTKWTEVLLITFHHLKVFLYGWLKLKMCMLFLYFLLYHVSLIKTLKNSM